MSHESRWGSLIRGQGVKLLPRDTGAGPNSALGEVVARCIPPGRGRCYFSRRFHEWEGHMIDRRRAIRLAVAAALPALLPLSPARAQQSFQRFLPLLVDLPGWTGEKPDGMAMEMPGNSIV